jgi:hypothetical protein
MMKRREEDEDFCATMFINRHGIGMKTKRKKK